MTRRARMWMVIAAVPVVLLGAGAVVLKVMFTGDRLRALLLPRLEAATGRAVTLGDVSLALVPSLGVEARDLRIANRTGEDFSSGPMLTLEALRVNVRLWPLLSSRLEVTSLEVLRPRLLVEITPAGLTNYEDLGGGQAGADAPPGAPSGPPPALAVSDLQVIDASVDYVDRKGNSATRIRNLDLAMAVAAEGNALVITGTGTTDSLSYGTVETPLLSGLRLSLTHRLRYDVPADLLTVEQGDLILQDIRLRLAGTSAHNRTAPVLDFTLGSDSLNIADLLSLLPAGSMAGAGEVRGTGTAAVRIAMTGTLTDSTEADYTGTVTTAGARVQYARLPKPITDITIRSSFTKTRSVQEFRIDELTANLGGTPIRLTMLVRNFDDPLLTLAASGSLNLGTLHEVYPVGQDAELAGMLDLDVRINGRVRDQKTLQASGALTFRNVRIAGASAAVPLQNLTGSVRFTNDVLETPGLSLLIGRSDLALSGRIRNYLSAVSADPEAPRSTAALTLRSRRLVMADVMTPAPASASGAPGGGAPKSAFVLPAADVTLNASVDSLLLEKFSFAAVRGTLRLSDNIVRMENLSLRAFDGSLSSAGSLDLSNRSRPLFDLTLTLSDLQAAQVLSPFTSFGRRLTGGLSMSAAFKGALDDTLGIIPSSLRGGGSAALRNGALTGFAVNDALAGRLNLPDLRTVAFRDWKNSFSVENGRLLLRDLSVTALNAEYVLNGSHGLDGTLDYRLEVLLPGTVRDRLNVPGFAGDAVDLFKAPDGRLRFEAAVTGTQEKPAVQLLTEGARKKGEELARQKLDAEKKRLENELKRKGENLLKNLFRKDSTP